MVHEGALRVLTATSNMLRPQDRTRQTCDSAEPKKSRPYFTESTHNGNFVECDCPLSHGDH